jgi:hypothetical protein
MRIRRDDLIRVDHRAEEERFGSSPLMRRDDERKAENLADCTRKRSKLCEPAYDSSPS